MSDQNQQQQDQRTPEQIAAEERQQQRQQQQQNQQQGGNGGDNQQQQQQQQQQQARLPDAKDDPEPLIDDFDDLDKWTEAVEAWETRENAREVQARQERRRQDRQQRQDGDQQQQQQRQDGDQRREADDIAQLHADAAQREMISIVGRVAGDETQGKLATMLAQGEIVLSHHMLEKLDDVLATTPDGADRIAAVLAHFVDHPQSSKAMARATRETQLVRMERMLESASETARAAATRAAQSEERGSAQLRPAAGGLRDRNVQRRMEEAAKKGDFATYSKLRDEAYQPQRNAG